MQNEQYLFSEDTRLWLFDLIKSYSKVVGIFTPSLLNANNITVYDIDGGYIGKDNYICVNFLNDSNIHIMDADLYIIDPPFYTIEKTFSESPLFKLFDIAYEKFVCSDLLFVFSNYMTEIKLLNQWIQKLRLKPYWLYFPTYREISNIYVEYIPKPSGSTSIMFWTNFIPYVRNKDLFSVRLKKSDGSLLIKESKIIKCT